MTDFTSLRESIAALTTAITSTYADILHTTNDHKEQLASIYQALNEDRADLLEFGKMLGDLADVLDATNDNCQDIAVKVTTTIMEGMSYLPESKYEEFVEYCDNCGSEIRVGDEYRHDGADWYTCAECLAVERADELVHETETTDEE